MRLVQVTLKNSSKLLQVLHAIIKFMISSFAIIESRCGLPPMKGIDFPIHDTLAESALKTFSGVTFEIMRYSFILSLQSNKATGVP